MEKRKNIAKGISLIPILLGILVVLLLAYTIWRFVLSPAPGSSAPSPAPPSTTAEAQRVDPLQLTAATGDVLDPSGEHTWFHGHYLGKACQLAYRDGNVGPQQFLEQLNLSARLVSVDNTQAYVGENAESIVVAFRGSESPASLDGFKDWLLTNARNFLVLPEGRIGTDFAAAGVGARFHRGFMEALAEIWAPLRSAVDEAIRRKERPVWITGHSLGGAIALLAAWRFHQAFIPVHRVCTFGAPMIGNAAAADAYHREFPNKIIRYVDYSDMVPKLPTFSMLSNEYGHVQREIIVGHENDLSASHQMAALRDGEQSQEGELNQHLADQLWGNLHSGISAHLMDNYISQLSQQLT